MLCLVVVLLLPALSWAHGYAGKRFFPTTLSVEDPFVSDELSFLFGYIKAPGGGGEPSVKTTSFGVDYSKRITPHLGISIGDEYRHLSFTDDGSEDGFGNLELGLKYQFYTNEVHEAIFSLGTSVEIGGTGSSRIGAESFSVVSPALYFGKGLGDLPDSLHYLRPLAITGVIGPNIPTRAENQVFNEDTGEKETERNPNTLTWAFTVQYSFIYLQSFVKDIGLGSPLNRMILLVELPLETCLDRGCRGQTTGMVNPGVVWIGKYTELGISAQIPINRESGRNIGVLGLVHFFIDDLFPKSIGRPIFP
jgi:hypothetical protein